MDRILSTALSVKNLTWNGTKSNPAHRDIRPVCNRLIHGVGKLKVENLADCELYFVEYRDYIVGCENRSVNAVMG
jgi:hypothetical protein